MFSKELRSLIGINFDGSRLLVVGLDSSADKLCNLLFLDIAIELFLCLDKITQW